MAVLLPASLSVLIHILIIFLIITAGHIFHPVFMLKNHAIVFLMPSLNIVSGSQPISALILSGAMA